MATTETTPLSTLPRVIPDEFIPPLRNGDCLTGPEFERRYMAMPEVKKAELIEGVVSMPSPVRMGQHSNPHNRFATFLGIYELHTPGVEAGDDPTIRLDEDNRPQPDHVLRIIPGYGGRSRTEEKYIAGAPELLTEISASTVSRDLNQKFTAYRRNGVLEYLVWRVEDQQFDYFVLRAGAYEPLTLSEGGIYRSEVFPGLWLDAAALLRRDLVRLHQVLHYGLNSPEHAAFVEQLRQAKHAAE